MTNRTARWWKVIELRDEVTSSGGAIDDVQMSLYNAVFGRQGVGAGRTPYSDAAYFSDITHPTKSLVELMARIAVRSGFLDRHKRVLCGDSIRLWVAANHTG